MVHIKHSMSLVNSETFRGPDTSNPEKTTNMESWNATKYYKHIHTYLSPQEWGFKWLSFFGCTNQLQEGSGCSNPVTGSGHQPSNPDQDRKEISLFKLSFLRVSSPSGLLIAHIASDLGSVSNFERHGHQSCLTIFQCLWVSWLRYHWISGNFRILKRRYCTI